MKILAHVASAAVAMLLFTTVSAAQQMTAPATANVGEAITICYSNPDKAGQTVDVRVFDDNGALVDTLQIQVNADGEGCVTWTVPPTVGGGYEFLANDAGTSTMVGGG